MRRSGSKEVTLDRAGWLKERKRMFDRGMRVDFYLPKIEPAEASDAAGVDQPSVSLESQDSTGDWTEESGMNHEKAEMDYEFLTQEGQRAQLYDLVVTESEESSSERSHNSTSSTIRTHYYTFDPDTGMYVPYEP